MYNRGIRDCLTHGSCRQRGFNPWVGKISQRRKRQPTLYSCLGNAMDKGAWLATVSGVAESDMI